MRVTLGTLGALGCAVTVAVAQPPHERAAVLKPPVPLVAGEVPVVARGAADVPPAALGSTPVVRRAPGTAGAPPTGPSWLTGADPNLQPAGGAVPRGVSVRPLTPAEQPQPEPRFRDRVKNALPSFGRDAPPPSALPDQLTKRPAGKLPGVAEQYQPTAGTAFKAVSATGAPVYAGPPAYRWYGWGSVTPGANPLAPAGQYPKASAAWYSITGATPGAFPVPVTTGGQPLPGVEPPNYGVARSQPAPAATGASPAWSAPVASAPPAPPIVPPRPYTESKFQPPASVAVPPSPAPGVPTITLPPVASAAAGATPVAPPAIAMSVEPIAVAPPSPDVLVPPPAALVPPVAPVSRETVGAPEAKPAVPATAEVQWNRAAEPYAPQPGTWTPASQSGAPAAPALPPPPPAHTSEQPTWKTGSAAPPPVARGQADDARADPIAELVKRVCAGRAEGVEVRYTGTKKVVVCFEVRGKPSAEKLVADISARPELTAYQIEFCVVVK